MPSPLRAAMRPFPSLLQNPAKVGTCLSSTQPYSRPAWDVCFIYLFTSCERAEGRGARCTSGFVRRPWPISPGDVCSRFIYLGGRADGSGRWGGVSLGFVMRLVLAFRGGASLGKGEASSTQRTSFFPSSLARQRVGSERVTSVGVVKEGGGLFRTAAASRPTGSQERELGE